MDREYQKIEFYDEDQGGFAEFYVIERTKVNGAEYLFTAQDLEPGSDAFIFKVNAVNTPEGADMLIELVEDETELQAVGNVFAELLSDDVTIEM